MFNAFTNGNHVDAIYTDFGKAFEKVNRKALMKIIVSSGFGKPLLFWFSFYLINLPQYIKVFGIKFKVIKVSSRIPQGDTFLQSSPLFS